MITIVLWMGLWSQPVPSPIRDPAPVPPFYVAKKAPPGAHHVITEMRGPYRVRQIYTLDPAQFVPPKPVLPRNLVAR